MAKSFRTLIGEIVRAITEPEAPIEHGDAAAAQVTPAKNVEEKLIETLTGGQQNRRELLQRIGAWTAAAALPAGTAVNAASTASSALNIEEAAALYRASLEATNVITKILWAGSREVFELPPLIFSSKEAVMKKIHRPTMETMMDMGFWDILDRRTPQSIQRMCDAMEGFIAREEINEKNRVRLEAFLQEQVPDRNPYFLAYPERHHPHFMHIFDQLNKTLKEGKASETVGRYFNFNPVEQMREQLRLMREYLHHFTAGTVDAWAESLPNGSGTYDKALVEGPFYQPPANAQEAAWQVRKARLDTLLEAGVTVTSTLGRGPQAHKISIAGDLATLEAIGATVSKIYPDLSMSQNLSIPGLFRRGCDISVWEPRIVIEDPPYALAVLLEKHVRGNMLAQPR